jgi:hypothetical protein
MSGRRAWALVAVLFLLLGLAGIVNHEPWRDEAEIWLLARDSATLSELVENMGTQGHPALWYVLNFLLSRFTSDLLAMQLLNLLIGTAAALVFFRHAPFTLAQRLLFCFGYYGMYEFTVISRSYALQLLLVFGACALMARRGKLGPGAAALLVLLSNTNLFGTIVAAQIALLAALRLIRAGRAPGRSPDRGEVGAVGVVLAGVGLGFGHTLVQSLAIGPAHAGAYAPGMDLQWVLACLSTISFGYLPLADPTVFHTWNSNFLAMLPGLSGVALGALLGLGLLAGSARCVARSRDLLAVFLLGSGAMLGIVFFVWYGFQRHHGQVFLWFLVCLWLAKALRPVSAAEDTPADDRPSGRLCAVGLTVLLALQWVGGVYAFQRDLRHPFSRAADVGRFLGAAEFDDVVLVGSVDYAVEPIAAFTDRPFYYPESRRFGTFLDWSDRRELVSLDRVLQDAVDLFHGERRDVVIVLSYPTTLGLGQSVSLGDGIEMTHFARFDGALVADENYRLFRVHRRTEP